LLLDCGFSLKELERRLEHLSLTPDAIDALLLSHEHSDHIRGAGSLCRRHGIPLWATYGTWQGANLGQIQDLHLFHADQASFRIGNIEITPFTIPHDAREPCQFRFHHAGLSLGVLTDAGSITRHVRKHLDDLDGLILEANHDQAMLAQGPYPPQLKRRVASDHGHLSNSQAAEILGILRLDGLQQLIAAHLSETNNSPQRCRETLLGRNPHFETRTTLLEQDSPSPWFTLVD
jgi:phosphoribosyl 1,2-cyclic phosphodiesterase